jgi:hypothetical protein
MRFLQFLIQCIDIIKMHKIKLLEKANATRIANKQEPILILEEKIVEESNRIYEKTIEYFEKILKIFNKENDNATITFKEFFTQIKNYLKGKSLNDKNIIEIIHFMEFFEYEIAKICISYNPLLYTPLDI